LRAATAGDFEVLRWLRNHGAPWNKYVVTIAAASGRSATVELMQWLQQRPGIAFSADTMQAAVASGNLHICQYLQAVGCDANEECFLSAALSGNVEIVRFLHEHDCPWELRAVLRQSAAGGHVGVLTYLWHSDVKADAVLLTDMLNAAAAANHIEAAQWLLEQGALWPTVLAWRNDDGYVVPWRNEGLAWARAEGCTAPTPFGNHDADTGTDTDDDEDVY
jgi:Ankyrin repeats (3 copies)